MINKLGFKIIDLSIIPLLSGDEEVFDLTDIPSINSQLVDYLMGMKDKKALKPLLIYLGKIDDSTSNTVIANVTNLDSDIYIKFTVYGYVYEIILSWVYSDTGALIINTATLTCLGGAVESEQDLPTDIGGTKLYKHSVVNAGRTLNLEFISTSETAISTYEELKSLVQNGKILMVLSLGELSLFTYKSLYLSAPPSYNVILGEASFTRVNDESSVSVTKIDLSDSAYAELIDTVTEL